MGLGKKIEKFCYVAALQRYAAFLFLLYCFQNVMATNSITIIVKARTLAELRMVGWSFAGTTPTVIAKPSEFNRALEELDNHISVGGSTWMVNSSDSSTNFKYNFLDHSCGFVNNVKLFVRHFSQMAKFEISPCKPKGNCSVSLPSIIVAWHVVRIDIDNDRLAEADVSKIQLRTDVLPGGYILFDEIKMVYEEVECTVTNAVGNNMQEVDSSDPTGSAGTGPSSEQPPNPTTDMTTESLTTEDYPTTPFEVSSTTESEDPSSVPTTESWGPSTVVSTEFEGPTYGPTESEGPTDGTTEGAVSEGSTDGTTEGTVSEGPTDGTTEGPTAAPVKGESEGLKVPEIFLYIALHISIATCFILGALSFYLVTRCCNWWKRGSSNEQMAHDQLESSRESYYEHDVGRRSESLSRIVLVKEYMEPERDSWR